MQIPQLKMGYNKLMTGMHTCKTIEEISTVVLQEDGSQFTSISGCNTLGMSHPTAETLIQPCSLGLYL